MELLKLKGLSEYRLLLLQPDPETGERICVGIATENDLLYDINSSRLQCFSTKLPSEIVRFYLKEIRERISRSESGKLNELIKDFAPLFVISEPHQLLAPLTESVKQMLLSKFVSRGESRSASRLDVRREFSIRLSEIARRTVGAEKFQIIENAGATDIFGEKRQGLGRVALALKREDKTVLMDGLDMNLLAPPAVIQTSAKIVHTFWQYGRASRPYGESIKRVAVVFNGKKNATPSYRDAHAFAVDQFHKEADETIEAAEGQDLALIGAALH